MIIIEEKLPQQQTVSSGTTMGNNLMFHSYQEEKPRRLRVPAAHFDTHPEGQMKFTTEMNEGDNESGPEEMAEMQGVFPSNWTAKLSDVREEKTETSYPQTQRSGESAKPVILKNDACLKGNQ